MSKNYIPDVGDIIWLNFTAQAALKLIEKMPESVQMQAKTNLYTSQLSEIQQKKSVDEPEIDR